MTATDPAGAPHAEADLAARLAAVERMLARVKERATLRCRVLRAAGWGHVAAEIDAVVMGTPFTDDAALKKPPIQALKMGRKKV